jgi:hypothetical protein
MISLLSFFKGQCLFVLLLKSQYSFVKQLSEKLDEMLRVV